LNNRIKTGIRGLDEIIGGGFFQGDFVLLAGDAGSGKTIFCSQYICYGAKNGENGIIATFEEDRETLIRNMESLGLGIKELEENKKIKILDLEAFKGAGLQANLEFIVHNVKTFGAKRLVIDSINAFCAACKEKFEYRTIMHFLYRIFKRSGVTTIATCGIPTGSETFGLGFEEFIADVLIILENYLENYELKRRLLVRKMRGSIHSRKYHNVIIDENGISIVPLI